MKTKKTKKYAVGGYQPVGLPVSSADIRADKRQTQKDAGFWKDFGKFVSERVLPMAGPIGAGIGAVASMGLSKGFEPARYTADMPNNYAVDTTPQLPAQELQLNTGQNNGLGFKSGGSIHINPANKGKFNATKKRTGKTTEELTHSKNPLTRKRAIFAQNAAKWHHETGGPITPIVQDSIPAFKYMPTVTNPSQVNSTATPIFTGLPEVKPVMPDLMGDAIREAASYGGFRGSSLKVKSKDRYREHATGGPLDPGYMDYNAPANTTQNIQKLGNITFNSNLARKGKFGQLNVKDIATGKDYAVLRNDDGTYRYFTAEDRPKYHAAEVARQQVIDNLNSMKGKYNYTPTESDSISAAIDSKNYKFLLDKSNVSPGQDSILSNIINKRNKDSVKYYQDKIDRVRGVQPKLTDKLGPEGESGSVTGKTNMVVYAPDSLHTVNTARHEFEHVAQSFLDYDKIFSDAGKLAKNATDNYSFRSSGYDQEDFNYLSDPNEIGARLFNLKTIMKERGFKTLDEARDWSNSNRVLKSDASYSAKLKGFDATDPNFDIHQLFDLYGGDMKLLKEHYDYYNTPKKGTYYATGGDIQLNSGAFQVQGNAQTTDGNKYNMGGENVALDHNEVVRDNFVFSDILTNPLTGNKFSKDAKVIEKKIGKSEKKIQAYNDLISKKTLNHLKGISKDLEKVHEVVATSKGMRNTDGSTKQHFATGGTVDGPGPGYIQMEDNNWYNPTTKSILTELDGKYIQVVEAADYLVPEYEQMLKSTNQFSGFGQADTGTPTATSVQNTFTPKGSTGPNYELVKEGRKPGLGLYRDRSTGLFYRRDSRGQYTKANSEDQAGWSQLYPLNNPSPTGNIDQILNDRLYGDPYATPDSTLSENAPIGTGTAPTVPVLGTTPGTSTPKKATTPAKVRPTIVPPSVGGFYNPAPAEGNRTMPDGSVVPDYLLPNNTTPYNPQQTPEQRAAATEHMPFIWDTQKDAYNKPWKTDEGRQAGLTAGDTTTTPPPNADQYRTPFTAGDALQGIGAFSKFAQALSGVEQEPTRANTAPITKQVYDPRAPLYQNQRNFSNALNSIQAGSLNTRRAVASQLFANKLNSDSSILDRYSQMNLGARTQYEQRLADRQRENIGYANYASDLNARNRAARTNNLDVAFDTLSNFGASLNQKKQAADMINIYRKLFPSIEKNILSALG